MYDVKWTLNEIGTEDNAKIGVYFHSTAMQ